MLFLTLIYFILVNDNYFQNFNAYYTVPTGPNLTESGPKPDPGFAFGVRSGSARMDPGQTPTGPRPHTKQTQSGPRAEEKRTPKANPNFRSKPVKRTPGSALRNRAVNQDY